MNVDCRFLCVMFFIQPIGPNVGNVGNVGRVGKRVGPCVVLVLVLFNTSPRQHSKMKKKHAMLNFLHIYNLTYRKFL